MICGDRNIWLSGCEETLKGRIPDWGTAGMEWWKDDYNKNNKNPLPAFIKPSSSSSPKSYFGKQLLYYKIEATTDTEVRDYELCLNSEFASYPEIGIPYWLAFGAGSLITVKSAEELA
jgi:hypothetical protein